MDVRIKWVRGHVEVYDRAGRFLFSADSEPSESWRRPPEGAKGPAHLKMGGPFSWVGKDSLAIPSDIG